MHSSIHALKGLAGLAGHAGLAGLAVVCRYMVVRGELVIPKVDTLEVYKAPLRVFSQRYNVE